MMTSSVCLSQTHVWYGISYHYIQSFADFLHQLWLMLIVIDNSGPLIWLSLSYNGAFTQNLDPVGHIQDADRHSSPGSD